jgi:hypothetical protein
MADEKPSEMLCQLLTHHYRSLPMFLTEASPWTHRGDENATQVVLDIVASQKELCSRIASEIQNRGGVVDLGEYPMDYLDLHFLSLDFLLLRLVEHQREEVVWIGQCAERLDLDPAAHLLAKEALGAARGYLESLEELMGKIPQRG